MQSLYAQLVSYFEGEGVGGNDADDAPAHACKSKTL